MFTAHGKPDRSGVSLTEILIGIMVLGIGVISLATLFPIGLLRMRRAVHDVRGTVVAQNAWNEVRVRNLLSPPFGPPADYFSLYPAPGWTQPSSGGPTVPLTGLGVPVVIDPLWMIQSPSLSNLDTYHDRLGFADFNNDGNADFVGGDGILRVRGGSPSGLFPLEMAWEVFASHDDVTFGDADRRMVPVQDATASGPPYLFPSNGTPYAPNTLSREARYTWLVIARKTTARQGIGPGLGGLPGMNGQDDDGNGVNDDESELGWPGTDDVRADVGPDLARYSLGASPPMQPDDPGRDMLSGMPVPAPVGPFEVTIVAFYSRDFTAREFLFANSGTTPTPIFTFGSDLARLKRRADVSFPDITIGSYVLDASFDSTTNSGIRNGFVYRVVGKSVEGGTGDLVLTLDQKARADGTVLIYLKGAVGVFEKQVP